MDDFNQVSVDIERRNHARSNTMKRLDHDAELLVFYKFKYYEKVLSKYIKESEYALFSLLQVIQGNHKGGSTVTW